MRNKLKERSRLFSVRFVAASNCERIIIGYVASVNERKCTIAWDCSYTLYERQQSDRYECLYSVPRREHGLHAHRIWQTSSATSRSLLFACSENGKYENDKLFRLPSYRRSSRSNQFTFLLRISSKKNTIDA